MPYRRKRNVRNVRRRRRRGFGLDLDLGGNVPLFGGSKLRLGTRAVKKIARREIMNQEETKLITFGQTNFGGGTGSNSPLLNNTVYTYNPVHLISQGVQDYQRTGQQIFIRHIRFRILIDVSTSSSSDYEYRMMVITSERNYNNAGTSMTPQSLVSASDLFLPNTYGGFSNLHHAMINNKQGNKVLCDRRVTVKATEGTTASPISREFNLECPIFKKVTFLSTTPPSLLKDVQYHLVLIPNVPGSLTSTTHVPKVSVSALVSYKDA